MLSKIGTVTSANSPCPPSRKKSSFSGSAKNNSQVYPSMADLYMDAKASSKQGHAFTSSPPQSAKTAAQPPESYFTNINS